MIKLTLCFAALVFAGSPEIFKKTAFFNQPSQGAINTLDFRLQQLRSLEKNFSGLTSEFLQWGTSYHRFRLQIQKDLLNDILSYTGQSDFFKELGKCGMIEDIESEDMVSVKDICSSENKIKDLATKLMNEFKSKAEDCVNVKDKFKIKISNAYDEFFEHQKIFLKTGVDSNDGLGNEAVGEQRFKIILENNRQGLKSICEDYYKISSKVKNMIASTDTVLSALL
jgi:hypothetical protein